MNQPIKPIQFSASSVFAGVKERDEIEKQQLISKEEEKAVYLRNTLKTYIPEFIELINRAVTNKKGKLGSNSDNGEYVTYQLELGKLSNKLISKLGLLYILGKVYTEFKNAGWNNFSIWFSASELDYGFDRYIYGDALYYFVVEVRVFKTFEPHDGVHVTDYGPKDKYISRSGCLKSFYRLEEIPDIDTLNYIQLARHR